MRSRRTAMVIGWCMSRAATTFYEDVRHARLLLEDIAGVPVSGYRAPGFSTTADTPWFFDALAEAGYQYDSSVFPARTWAWWDARRTPRSASRWRWRWHAGGAHHRSQLDGQAYVFFWWRLFAAVSLLAGSQNGAAGSGGRPAGGVLYSSAGDRPRPSSSAHESRAPVQVLCQSGNDGIEGATAFFASFR